MTNSPFDAHTFRWQTFDEATQGLTPDEVARTDAFLVGWLGGLVTPEQWTYALETAVARTLSVRALYQDDRGV